MTVQGCLMSMKHTVLMQVPNTFPGPSSKNLSGGFKGLWVRVHTRMFTHVYMDARVSFSFSFSGGCHLICCVWWFERTWLHRHAGSPALSGGAESLEEVVIVTSGSLRSKCRTLSSFSSIMFACLPPGCSP